MPLDDDLGRTGADERVPVLPHYACYSDKHAIKDAARCNDIAAIVIDLHRRGLSDADEIVAALDDIIAEN